MPDTPEDPHDELTELESAIHHLKEAQMLHDEERYNAGREDAAMDCVEAALGEMESYIDKEFDRLKGNSPVHSIEEE